MRFLVISGQLTNRCFLKVLEVEAAASRRSLRRIVHQQVVEQAYAGRTQPGKSVLQIVVQLLGKFYRFQRRQLRITLRFLNCLFRI